MGMTYNVTSLLSEYFFHRRQVSSFFRRWIAVGDVEPGYFRRTEQQLFLEDVLTIGFSRFVVRYNHCLYQRPAQQTQFVEHIHGGVHLLDPYLECCLIDEAIQQGTFDLARFNPCYVWHSPTGCGVQLNIDIRRLLLGLAKGSAGEEEAKDEQGTHTFEVVSACGAEG